MAIDIDDINRRNQYTATPAQDTFIYSFPILAATDMSVYLTPVGQDANDSVDLLTIATEYTVTGVGVQTGGTIVLVTPATTGDTVTINGNTMPLARTSKFSINSIISSETLDEEFNNLLLMVQQVNTKIDKLHPRYQYSAIVDSKVDRIMPILSSEKGWEMNDERTKIEAVDIGGGGGGYADLLRAELADQTAGIDGTRLVGYNHPSYGGLTTHDILDIIIEDIDNIQTGVFKAVTITGPNSYTGSLSEAPSSYNIGMIINTTIVHTNTAPSTLNLNGLGVIPLRTKNGEDFLAGSLVNDTTYQFVYASSDEWRLFNYVRATVEDQGIIELATGEEAWYGIDSQRAITPATLKSVTESNFEASYNQTGYRTFPGGFIIQWGLSPINAQTHVTIILPYELEILFNVQATLEAGSGIFPIIHISESSLTQFKVFMSGTGIWEFHWLVLGKIA